MFSSDISLPSSFTASQPHSTTRGRIRLIGGRLLLTFIRLPSRTSPSRPRERPALSTKRFSSRLFTDSSFVWFMMEQSLVGKRVAVLVETEFIPMEIDCYRTRFPELGAQVDLLTYLWGKPERELVPDIDSPDKPIRDLGLLKVNKDVGIA